MVQKSENSKATCDRGDSPVEPHGILVLNKPPGPTAFDCIRFLRKTCGITKKWKMGHLGTLDPFASGVMVIALGQAVRYSKYGLGSRKKYRARLWLGDETDTLDPSGNVTRSADVPNDWPDRLDEIRDKFTGLISQVPPQFSAKHVNGIRAYESARRGESVKLDPVDVEIYSLQFGDLSDQWMDFTADVSSGTYIRALGRDIAYELCTVGHLLGLERIQSGPFPIEEAIPYLAFENGGSNVLYHHLRPVEQILYSLPEIQLAEGIDVKIQNGIPLSADEITNAPDSYDHDTVYRLKCGKKFLALGKFREGKGLTPFKPWPV